MNSAFRAGELLYVTPTGRTDRGCAFLATLACGLARSGDGIAGSSSSSGCPHRASPSNEGQTVVDMASTLWSRMGWRERDYARFTDAERAAFFGTSRPATDTAPAYAPPVRRSPFRAGVGPAMAVSALLYALGHFPSGHPLVPLLHGSLNARTHATPAAAQPTVTSQPPPPPPVQSINGPASAPVDSYLTLSGSLPANTSGTVSVDGSYDGVTWFSLATVPATTVGYTARVPLERTGVLHLRITRPDGVIAMGTITVTSAQG